jgi:hypothetical protein
MSDVTIKTTPWKIRALAQLKRERKLHLPDLQRGFRWSPDRICALHDSLYRRYPIGALLLWKPSWTGEPPFRTRPWDIWPPNPITNKGEREAEEPISPGSLFVLDGQQRLTSLFRIIFQSRTKGGTTHDPELLVALSPEDEWVEAPFWLGSNAIRRRMKEGLLVKAEVLFEGVRGGNESLAVRKAISEWVKTDDPLFFEALNRANFIRNAVLENEIVAYEIDADAEDESVIEIFARLNQQGVSLRSSELAAARLTGQMENFREKAREVLSHKAFTGFVGREGQEDRVRFGGFVDTDLLIRTSLYLSTGNLRYSNLDKKKTGIAQTFGDVARVWDKACNSMRLSTNMFRTAGVPEGRWLPYRYLLMIPAIASAAKDSIDNPGQWIGWAVAASLWGHYRGAPDTVAQGDAIAAGAENIDLLLTSVRTRAKRPDSALPQEDDVTENVVQEAGVLLALLIHFVRTSVRSFPAGKLIASHAEPIEIHHIFPRKIIDDYPEADNSYMADRLGNLTLIFRSDNESLGDTPPAKYLGTLSAEDRTNHLIPDDMKLWTIERYLEFCNQRERNLAVVIVQLLQDLGVK